jgi:hypothetical protein
MIPTAGIQMAGAEPATRSLQILSAIVTKSKESFKNVSMKDCIRGITSFRLSEPAPMERLYALKIVSGE